MKSHNYYIFSSQNNETSFQLFAFILMIFLFYIYILSKFYSSDEEKTDIVDNIIVYLTDEEDLYY